MKTRSGAYTLRLSGEDGAEKTVHSLYDPAAEARSLADAFPYDGRGVLVVLGLGLGYHIAELAERFPDAEIIVIEESAVIYDLFLKHGKLIDGNINYFIGLSAADALKEITRIQMTGGISPLSVFQLNAEVSAFRNYYEPILESLKKTVSIKLWDRFKYLKFRGENQKVILIDTGYFLVREIERALSSRGNKVARIPVNDGNRDEDLIPRIMETILEFRPDFVLTLNHLGFDEEGELASFLKSIEMPAASWYVDSPKLIVRAYDKNVSPFVSIFLWDRSYISDMRSMGFDSVSYIPLGTDESIFRPLNIKKHRKKISKYACDAGFVGNSMVGPVREWLSKVREELHPVIETLAAELCGSGESFDAASARLHEDHKQIIGQLSEKEKMDFEAAVLWKATLLYRMSCVKMLEGFHPVIHGDDGWSDLIDREKFRISPPLNYYKNLPLFYNACKINFNATSIQMKEAVNQRVFDVPACGAFLMTDYKQSLDGLFETGKEIIVFREKEEIPELAGFYLRNADKRDAVAARGRERVMREHTYGHRLAKLIQSMKSRYK